MSEAKISAIIVSILTGIGLMLMLSEAFQSLAFALTFAVPVTLVMGAVLTLFASDNVFNRGGDKLPKGN